MPLYRYQCKNCKAEFTKLMTFRERENKNTQIFCPECGSDENTPLINRTSFSLKGKGWYKDGYKSKEEK